MQRPGGCPKREQGKIPCCRNACVICLQRCEAIRGPQARRFPPPCKAWGAPATASARIARTKSARDGGGTLHAMHREETTSPRERASPDAHLPSRAALRKTGRPKLGEVESEVEAEKLERASRRVARLETRAPRKRMHHSPMTKSVGRLIKIRKVYKVYAREIARRARRAGAGAAIRYANSTRSFRPSAVAARRSVSNVTELLSGSSRRSS